jgi:hypothetical protein
MQGSGGMILQEREPLNMQSGNWRHGTPQKRTGGHVGRELEAWSLEKGNSISMVLQGREKLET